MRDICRKSQGLDLVIARRARTERTTPMSKATTAGVANNQVTAKVGEVWPETPPEVGEKVWMWSYHDGFAFPVTYLGKRGSWTKWQHGEKTFNWNGLPLWAKTKHECTWFKFVQTFVYGRNWHHHKAMGAIEAEKAFPIVCEYVRCFSEFAGKSCSQIWEEGSKNIPGEGEKHGE